MFYDKVNNNEIIPLAGSKCQLCALHGLGPDTSLNDMLSGVLRLQHEIINAQQGK